MAYNYIKIYGNWLKKVVFSIKKTENLFNCGQKVINIYLFHVHLVKNRFWQSFITIEIFAGY